MTEVEAEVAVAKRARGAGAEAGGAGDDLEKLEIVLVKQCLYHKHIETSILT